MEHYVTTLEVHKDLIDAIGLESASGIASISIDFNAGDLVKIIIKKHATDVEVGNIISIVEKYNLVKDGA